jgi:hypothetical protein
MSDRARDSRDRGHRGIMHYRQECMLGYSILLACLSDSTRDSRDRGLQRYTALCRQECVLGHSILQAYMSNSARDSRDRGL